MSLRITLFLLAFALIIAGGELLRQSSAMPEWTDEAKAMEVQAWNPPLDESPAAVEAFNARWVKAINALRSNKWPTHDAGAALIAFAASLVAGLALLRVRTASDVAALTTPRRGWMIYAIGLTGWCLYWASAGLALVEGVNRFEFPPGYDSQLMLILLIAGFTLVGVVVTAVISYFVLHKSILPVSLWVWRKDMPGHDWFYTIAAGVSILVALEVLRECYLYGHWLGVPAMGLWIYATLAMRAAGISKTA